MGQQLLKVLYGLHSWFGLVLGLVLYAVCFSGTVALFLDELGPWERGTAVPIPAIAPGFAGLDETIAAVLAARDGGPTDIFVLLPDSYRSHAVLQVAPGGNAPAELLQVDPASSAERPGSDPPGAAILTALHTDLLLPSPWGRYLVGGFGVAMLVSLLSGILLHRKILQDLFAFRLGRSRRLAWSDAHRSLGLWGLPFHLTIALTGAMLGFAGLALPLSAGAAYDGDMAAAFAELGTAPARDTGERAAPLPVHRLLAGAREALPGLLPERLSLQNAGDAGATAMVMGTVPGALVYFPAVTLEAATGRLLAVTDWSRESPGRQVYAAVTPLHYASYGGLALKLLYALLGAGSCLLIVSSLQVWNSRHAGSAASGLRAALRLTAGTVHGLPFAATGLFVAGRLLPPAMLQNAGAQDAGSMTALFLALWLAGQAWPWCRGADRAARDLTVATGLLLLALPLLTWHGTGRHLGDALAAGALPLALVDLAALLAGLALLCPAGRRALAALRRRQAAPARR